MLKERQGEIGPTRERNDVAVPDVPEYLRTRARKKLLPLERLSSEVLLFTLTFGSNSLRFGK